MMMMSMSIGEKAWKVVMVTIMTWYQARSLETLLNLSFPLLIAGLPPTNLDAFIFLCNYVIIYIIYIIFIYNIYFIYIIVFPLLIIGLPP